MTLSTSSSPATRGPVWYVRWLLTRAFARAPSRRPAGAVRSYRAAIVKVDRIGDFVLAVSAIRTALAHYGEQNCVLVISTQAEPLVAREFPVVARIALPAVVGHVGYFSEAGRARAALSAISCDEVICLRHQRTDWDELILHWLNAPRYHVLDDAAGGLLSPARVTHAFNAPVRVTFSSPATGAESGAAVLSRELTRHQFLLERALARPVSRDEVLPRFLKLDRGTVEPAIVVSPFGSHALRDFPAPLLLETLRELRRRTPTPIRLHGIRSQHERLRELAEWLRNQAVSDVECAPPVGVVEFAETVAAATCVVSVETATAHFAAAFDRPAILLIGGGHYGQFGPWARSARQHWVTNSISCFGCNWACIQPEPYCVTHVTGEAVHAAIAALAPGLPLQ
jgi:ADP-heptose:LPS heptosyltransferase